MNPRPPLAFQEVTLAGLRSFAELLRLHDADPGFGRRFKVNFRRIKPRGDD